MKYLLALLITLPVSAATLKLEDFDQLKLATLLERLPEEFAPREKMNDDRLVRITFTAADGAVQINCTTKYFNDSPYPSEGNCQVTVDENHQALEQGYDEVMLKDTRGDLATALYNAISYGTDVRHFRSAGNDAGIDFHGRNTRVFHYMISCSKAECAFRFSKKRFE